MKPKKGSKSVIPKAEIRKHRGLPTLFINGKPNAGIGYSTYHRHASRWISAFKEAGVNILNISEAATKILNPCFQDPGRYKPPQPLTWEGPNRFNYAILDKHLKDVLKVHPDAYLVLRVDMLAPDWWCEKYPDETAKQADPSCRALGYYHQPYHSWASEKWRRVAAIALRRFIKHVMDGPYAGRVIGYHVADGATQEWFSHGAPWDIGGDNCFWDYSEPCREAFIRSLKKKYGTVEKLRKSWKDSKVRFNSVQIPSREKRINCDLGIFRDPEKSQRVIDYYLFYNNMVVDLIEYYAHVVKETTDYRSLCGVFYGYTLGIFGSCETGHLALGRLLRCGDIDYVGSPTGYAGRPIGSGCSSFNVPVDVVMFHDKLFWTENDPATHLHQRKDQPVKNVTEAISIQKRELAQTICKGNASYWFDIGGGWYDDPKLMKAVARMDEIAELSLEFDRTSVAQVAVVIDEASMCYVDGTARFGLPGLLLNRQRLGLAKSGVAFDYVFLEDLGCIRPYKVYLFLNTFWLDAKRRRLVKQVVKKNGKFAVWVYAPGFINKGLSDKDIYLTTGIEVAHLPVSQPLDLKITDFSDDITKNLPKNIAWEKDKTKAVDYHRSDEERETAPTWGKVAISPVFHGVDPEAKVLGVLNGKVAGKPGLQVKRFPGWTSVYCAVPNLPGWLIRGIASSAGVHVYSKREGDSLNVNKSFIGIHTDKSGKRVLRFPKKVSLYDLFKKKWIAENSSSVAVNLPAKHTGVYFYGERNTQVE